MHWLFAILLLLSAPARADSGMLMGGVASRQMPLDAITVPTACYSERRLRTAYTAGVGINIVRASDSATQDIGFTPAGFPATATETAFCAATTCKLVTMYDQCGSNNLTQATDANRYARTSSGPSSGFNASRATAVTQSHVGGSNITPATGLVSLAAVGNRAAGTDSCTFIRENGHLNNRLVGRSAVTDWRLTGGTSGVLNVGAADAAWHAAIGVINNTNSVLNIDGVEAGPGTNPIGNVTAGSPAIFGAASTTCDQVEVVIWDNEALPAGSRGYYVNSARAAWRF